MTGKLAVRELGFLMGLSKLLTRSKREGRKRSSCHLCKHKNPNHKFLHLELYRIRVIMLMLIDAVIVTGDQTSMYMFVNGTRSRTLYALRTRKNTMKLAAKGLKYQIANGSNVSLLCRLQCNRS